MRHLTQRRGEISFADGVLRKENEAVDTDLIVGLGNMGEKYAHTRHNAGFEVIDRLAERLGTGLKRKQLLLRGEAASCTEGDKKIVLCKPTTFMNNSGECVKRLLKWYHCAPDQMMVVCDDIDLPPGRIRVRKDGGPGTHNGMRSIIGCIGESGFPRIRIGTGDRPAGQDLVEWVLGRCAPEEQEMMDRAIDRAAEAALVWVREGINAAMNQGNRK